MRFKHYEGLRTFCVVARHGQISSASQELNLTKGAVSHQIKALEGELGFDLFHREVRGVRPTQKGQQLLHVARSAFDSVDRQIMVLREERQRSVTLGTSTYFASRWLSPRLMEFVAAHPKIRLRIQPMVDLFDLEREGIDIAVRWGRGEWSDLRIEPLFRCPAFPTAAPVIAEKVTQLGLETAIREATLLDDRDGSPAWAEWLSEAGLPQVVRKGSLTIPDPNVRVQAVLDGQGIAINDFLVQAEIDAGRLCRISEVQMQSYGYHLAIPSDAMNNPDTRALVDWLKSSAAMDEAGA
ncbi:MAG: LysR substrate-binding domain-containing protein [Pseudomonadota bacterium]